MLYFQFFYQILKRQIQCNPKSISLKELFIISPLGFVGAFFTGLAHSAILGYGAVYAAAKGLGLFEISIFMLIVSSFGALFQWPIGYISDKIDRRIVLIGVTFIASGLSLFIVASSYISLIIFFLLLAIFAGMSLPIVLINNCTYKRFFAAK